MIAAIHRLAIDPFGFATVSCMVSTLVEGAIEDYDEEMQTYYDLRDANRRVASFCDQIVARLSSCIPKRQEVLKAIEMQGFDLKI